MFWGYSLEQWERDISEWLGLLLFVELFEKNEWSEDDWGLRYGGKHIRLFLLIWSVFDGRCLVGLSLFQEIIYILFEMHYTNNWHQGYSELRQSILNCPFQNAVGTR